MRKSYVYKITCKINDEFYFGSSFNAKSDWYWGGGTKIRERIAQYGKQNFVKEILGEFYDRVEAHKVENEYIEQFRHDEKCLNKRLDYHFDTYGEESCAKRSVAERGKTLSEEHRSKIGAANAIAQRGKHLSAATRAKMSDALRGKHFSEEHKAKMSAAKLGEKNPNFGKHLSEETRAKLSAVRRGKHWRKNTVTGKREWYD